MSSLKLSILVCYAFVLLALCCVVAYNNMLPILSAQVIPIWYLVGWGLFAVCSAFRFGLFFHKMLNDTEESKGSTLGLVFMAVFFGASFGFCAGVLWPLLFFIYFVALFSSKIFFPLINNVFKGD